MIHRVTNFCFLLNNFIYENPSSFKEASESPDAPHWMEAIRSEVNALNTNDTWTLVNRPVGVRTVSTRWVFTTKVDDNDNTIFKARLVARGFEQNKDFRFEEIYSPVAKLSSVRILLSLSSHFKYHIHQLDICNAFLNGFVNDSIYLEIPDGVFPDVDRSRNVLLLNRSLYGLKEAPKLWNLEFSRFVTSIGFKQCSSDECLYIFRDDDSNNTVYLLLYVDDILLCSPNYDQLSKFKSLIKVKFKCKDFNRIKNFLGLNIDYNRERGVLKINQKNLICKIAKRFNVTDTINVVTPLEEKLFLERISDKSNVTRLPYRELVGCLMYVMLGSRPDICYAISFFSSFQDSASDVHFKYLMRVLKYLYQTRDLSLTFDSSKSTPVLEVYCDADWANCPETRRSYSGCCAFFYGNLVSWFSRKQHLVTLSSSESELIALCEASRESIWLKRLILELVPVIDQNNVMNFNIYEDSLSCLKLIQNQNWNGQRSKHIDVKYRFVSELYLNKSFNFSYVPSSNQVADLFTKSLGNIKFNHFVNLLNLLR